MSSKNGDLSESVVITRDASGNIKWLENGNSEAGYRHILERHEEDIYAIDGIDSRQDIKLEIKNTINEGTPHDIPADEGGGVAYVVNPSDRKPLTVITGENGFTVTAIPKTY